MIPQVQSSIPCPIVEHIYCSPRHAAIKLVYPKFSRTNSYPIVLYNYIPIDSLIFSYLHYIYVYIYIPYYIIMYPLHMSLMFTLYLQFKCVKNLVPLSSDQDSWDFFWMFIWPLHSNSIPWTIPLLVIHPIVHGNPCTSSHPPNATQMLHRPQKPW